MTHRLECEARIARIDKRVCAEDENERGDERDGLMREFGHRVRHVECREVRNRNSRVRLCARRRNGKSALNIVRTRAN